MNFTDLAFVPSFLLIALLYFILPLSKRYLVLLAASLIFYASWSFWGFFYLIGGTLLAWACALLIERQTRPHTRNGQPQERVPASPADMSAGAEGPAVPKKKEGSKRAARLFLAIGVLLPALCLVLVKLRAAAPELSVTMLLPEGLYYHFTRTALHGALAEGSALYKWIRALTQVIVPQAAEDIVMPLGISYFTLSLISYVADVYWKKDRAQKNPLKLLLFAAYFPKIVEGPIARHRSLGEQLAQGHRFDYHAFCFGLQRMLWGYFKKLVIADRLSLLTDTVFGDYRNYHGSILLAAAVFAAFALYCDFSGCMDIALGTSEALGIRLEENFNRPFFSRTASEFWRRWHITLGTWFKDYIYMPLTVSPVMISLSGKIRGIFGKSREESGRAAAAKRGRRAGRIFLTVIPTAAVWLLTGLWHGTGANYIVWGIYWGTLILLANVFEPEIRKLTALLHINPKSSGWTVFQRIRTFLLFVVSRIISIPSSLAATGTIFYRIVCSFGVWELADGTLLELGLDWPQLVLSLLLLVFLMRIESQQERGIVCREKIASYPVVCRWAIYLGAIFFVLIFGVYGTGYDAASFVYMIY